MSGYHRAGDLESSADRVPEQSSGRRQHHQRHSATNARHPNPKPSKALQLQCMSSARLLPQALQGDSHSRAPKARQGRLHAAQVIQADRPPQHTGQGTGSCHRQPACVLSRLPPSSPKSTHGWPETIIDGTRCPFSSSAVIPSMGRGQGSISSTFRRVRSI
jgi:hypothetical protein